MEEHEFVKSECSKHYDNDLTARVGEDKITPKEHAKNLKW